MSGDPTTQESFGAAIVRLREKIAQQDTQRRRPLTDAERLGNLRRTLAAQPRDPIEAAVAAAGDVSLELPSGQRCYAFDILALGLNDYRPDKHYARAAMREIVRAGIAAWLWARADDVAAMRDHGNRGWYAEQLRIDAGKVERE
jgi:hypothetical protein